MAKRKTTRQQLARAATGPSSPATPDRLLQDLRALIQQARETVAQAVNSALVLLYWEVGQRIRTDILNEQRAEYGEQIVPTLSAQLVVEFGDGFSARNLFRMIRFAEVFPDRQIVATLSRQLGWSHFVEIIPLRDDLQRDFYAEMCRIERWSVRTLRAKIQSMLFERTALSKKPAELARMELEALRAEDKLTPDLVFRDPYFLDFLGLSDTYSEKDLESAILRDLQQFILELGSGFAFIDRQKRIVIDGEDFYIDLLFYHRRLRRLLAIDLKIGKFTAADKGQMELYLRWLAKHEQQPGEETPLGLILCLDKSAEQIELLRLDQSGIRVASYLTDLPPRPLLQKKLHEAAQLARARLEAQSPAAEKAPTLKKPPRKGHRRSR
jgi:predicted nuclease of restriction endonuclease-like (RecB) superfamily